jgi:hypothetical protein
MMSEPDRPLSRDDDRVDEDPADRDMTLPADQRAGAVMRAIAVAGVVVALLATAVVWRFLTDLDRNLDQSLVIGEEAAATLVDTIDVADDVVTNLDAGLATLDRTLVTVSSTTADTGGVAASAAEIAGRLPTSFDDVDAALAQVESLSGTIDSALRTASRIPLGPDYDPATPLPDAVADVRAAFDPVGADLDELSTRLGGFAGDADQLATDLDDVRTDVQRTRTSLADSHELLDRYRATASRAQVLAREGRADFGDSLAWTRIAVVLLGAFAVVAQYVPWYLGRRLRS